MFQQQQKTGCVRNNFRLLCTCMRNFIFSNIGWLSSFWCQNGRFSCDSWKLRFSYFWLLTDIILWCPDVIFPRFWSTSKLRACSCLLKLKLAIWPLAPRLWMALSKGVGFTEDPCVKCHNTSHFIRLFSIWYAGRGKLGRVNWIWSGRIEVTQEPFLHGCVFNAARRVPSRRVETRFGTYYALLLILLRIMHLTITLGLNHATSKPVSQHQNKTSANIENISWHIVRQSNATHEKRLSQGRLKCRDFWY